MGMKIRLPLFGRGKKPINFEDDIANVITEDTKFNIKEAYKKLPVPQETNPYIDKKYRLH